MFQKHMFGSDATAYIRIELSLQGTLWRLLAQLPLELGQVFSFLPEAVNPNDLLFFKWHLHSRQDLEDRSIDYDYQLREQDFLSDYLNGASNRLLIFYGDTVPPGGHVRNLEGIVDTYRNVLVYPSFEFGEVRVTETYYIIPRTIAKADMGPGIAMVEQRPFICVLTSLPRGSAQLPSDHSLDFGLLQQLVERTEAIMISAYGGDAKLIWSRIRSYTTKKPAESVDSAGFVTPE